MMKNDLHQIYGSTNNYSELARNVNGSTYSKDRNNVYHYEPNFKLNNTEYIDSE